MTVDKNDKPPDPWAKTKKKLFLYSVENKNTDEKKIFFCSKNFF